MATRYQYATVSEACNTLRLEGYLTDFNLAANSINPFSRDNEPGEFEIVQIYRYEGETDPADEAAVYAIRAANGRKGIFVTGYGISDDSISTALLNKLTKRKA